MTEEPPCRIPQLPRTCARHAFSVAPQCCGAFLYFSRLTQGCARDSARFPWAIELSPPCAGGSYSTDRGTRSISSALSEADFTGFSASQCKNLSLYGEERAFARREDRLRRYEDCACAQSEDIPPIGGMREEPASRYPLFCNLPATGGDVVSAEVAAFCCGHTHAGNAPHADLNGEIRQ